MFTQYEDMEGNEKCKKLVGLGGYGSPKVIAGDVPVPYMHLIGR